MKFRKPTEEEVRNYFPLVSRGWETQREEVSYWVDVGSEVEGEIPQELEGSYIRNGPGLIDVFGTPLKHPIDGDGMVCMLTFIDGKVHFKNKFIETFNHVEETKARKMLYNGNMGSRVPLEGPENPFKMRNPAHTNAFYWGGKLLACHEYALPHVLDPSTLETVGVDTLNGKLNKIRALSAHYRYDAAHDTLVVIGFKAGLMGSKPKLQILEFDRKWNAKKDLFISIDHLNYVHDFMITPDYYVFHVTPFVDTREEAVSQTLRGEKAPGELLGYKSDLPSQMVVMERTGGKNAIYRFETEPCHIYHFQNCIQNGTKIRFGATCLPPGFNMNWQDKLFLSNVVDAQGLYYNYEIDIENKSCIRKLSPKMDGRANEFPLSNPYRHCVNEGDSKHPVLLPRYVYLMSSKPGVPVPFTDIVKYDEQGNEDDVWTADQDGVIGEPVFVPRYGRASAFYGDDDDGWIITQMYLPYKNVVQFIILDAKNVSKGPICRITPKVRVPYSFHGTFTPQIFTSPPTKL